jgi:hypothetical protein
MTRCIRAPIAILLRMLMRAIEIILLHFLFDFGQERFPDNAELATGMRISNFILQKHGKDGAQEGS